MKHRNKWRYLRLTLVLTLCAVLLTTLLTGAVSDSSTTAPAWGAPVSKALRKVGPATDLPYQSNLLANLDCTEITYRPTGSSVMQAGCFVETAFGLFELDSQSIIFGGTDEAVSLLPYSPHQILAPWPRTQGVLTIDPASTGGTYLGLYKNIGGHLQDQRNALGQLTSKKLTGPPDMILKDPSGNPLMVNYSTIAFSSGASWLVAETLNGSFVRINLASLDVKAFAPSFSSQGSPALYKSMVAISPDGRFVAIANNSVGTFKVYDLEACAGVIDNLHPLSCTAFDYWQYINENITGLKSISHVRFVNDYLLSFDATQGQGTDTYLMSPTNEITSLIGYLGTGDSYTSGEGAFDYLAGSDDGENECHLSAKSYPLLIARELYGSSGGHSVACSGATTHDISPKQPENYPGQVKNGTARKLRSSDNIMRILADFSSGYLPQIDFVNHYQPESVSVSVGGDDVGFGAMIVECVAPHISLHLSDGTCFDSYEDRLELKSLIDRTVPHLELIYRQIQINSPLTRLYVIGYPQIAIDNGNCGANVHLNKSELEFAAEIVEYLNEAMQKAANNSGASYVDISQALAGHRLCEAKDYTQAVNGLTAGKDGGVLGLKIFGKESYHPNALGQSLMAEAILRQTHNFHDPKSTTKTPPSIAESLLNEPKSGRPINVLIPASNVVQDIRSAGSSIPVSFNGDDYSMKNGTTYSIRLDGAKGNVVGSAVIDINGQVSGQITIPSNVPAGGHTVDIIGQGQGDLPIDIRQPIYIPSDVGDSDGDGIDDAVDSCPTAVNINIDIDGDGIDDSCDGSISPPDNTTGNGSGSGSTTNGSSSSSGGSNGTTGSASSNGNANGQGSTGNDNPSSNTSGSTVINSGLPTPSNGTNSLTTNNSTSSDPSRPVATIEQPALTIAGNLNTLSIKSYTQHLATSIQPAVSSTNSDVLGAKTSSQPTPSQPSNKYLISEKSPKSQLNPSHNSLLYNWLRWFSAEVLLIFLILLLIWLFRRKRKVNYQTSQHKYILSLNSG